jgi:hypothetical protein
MSINTSPDKGSYNIKIHEERLLMNPDDSDAEFIERSVASNSDCLVWVAVLIDPSFAMAIPLKSSAICLIFM